MVTRRMSAKEARDNFTDLLGTVYYGKEPVIVEKKGRPFVVVINPEEYERYQKMAKSEFFTVAERIQARNGNFSEEEVFSDITKTVDKVRQKNYGNTK